MPHGRKRALAIARNAPHGSIGAAIAPMLNPMFRLFGNFFGGNIGDFYKQQRPLLHSPATHDNIKLFARRETHFFKTSGGCSGLIGGLFSANCRADLIQRSASRLKRGGNSD